MSISFSSKATGFACCTYGDKNVAPDVETERSSGLAILLLLSAIRPLGVPAGVCDILSLERRRFACLKGRKSRDQAVLYFDGSSLALVSPLLHALEGRSACCRS